MDGRFIAFRLFPSPMIRRYTYVVVFVACLGCEQKRHVSYSAKMHGTSHDVAFPAIDATSINSVKRTDFSEKISKDSVLSIRGVVTWNARPQRVLAKITRSDARFGVVEVRNGVASLPPRTGHDIAYEVKIRAPPKAGVYELAVYLEDALVGFGRIVVTD